MRAKNDGGELELYVVAGTNSLVLSMDLKKKPEGLLGFAFERIDLETGSRTWLDGQKCFQSVIGDPVPGQHYPTHLHPVQSFLWKDFTVVPDHSYSMKVTPVFGKPKAPEYGDGAEIEFRTEPHIKDTHGVFFNRGVSGSQSYAEHFGNQRPDKMPPDLQKAAYAWLSRGLYEGLLAYIGAAKSGQKLKGAFYEFHYGPVLEAFKAAKDMGVEVNIVYSGKSYKEDNESAIAAAGLKDCCTHRRDNEVNEPHNKFMILCEANDKAVNVWTGSTNISEKAIFGHCNTGHIVKDRTIAEKYHAYWKALSENPDRKTLALATERIQADMATEPMEDGTTVFFSPRSTCAMLQQYADLIDGAKEMVCCIYPFNIDRRFQAVFKKDEPFIRYILLDSHKSYNAFQTDDKDVEVAAGSYIKSPIDQWVKETSSGQLISHGVDYLHNKFILIDPLSPAPIVITGSANYSENSTLKNDENTLIIKGDKRVADIYLTEFIRLFDHFSFREWVNENKDDFKPFLDETGDWVNKYFDSREYLSYKRKMVFKTMDV